MSARDRTGHPVMSVPAEGGLLPEPSWEKAALRQLDRPKAALHQNRAEAAWAAAAAVLDPELPVLTIEDLGVLRDVGIDDDGRVVVTITPTYSGCPAMDAIKTDIVTALESSGLPDAIVRTVLSPPWSTDWISAAGRQKLQDFGIAPPAPRDRTGPVLLALSVRCPRCGSADTRETSRFGSTACKSLWACNSCLEPFDHVKPI